MSDPAAARVSRAWTRRRFVTGLAVATAAATAATVARPIRAVVATAGGAHRPDWDGVFGAALGEAMGYGYAVARDGELVAGRGAGLSRSAAARTSPATAWTLDTPCNLASVSKTVTATAIMTVVQERGVALLDAPFWPLLAASGRFAGPPGAGVAGVTIRQLLTHTSGLAPDGTLYLRGRTVDEFLDAYLRRDAVAEPGGRRRYANTNFTILQVLLEVLTDGAPGSYVGLVRARVLAPAGVNEGQFTAVPDPATVALSYSDRADPRTGHFWPPMQCVGPGGWVATARGVLGYLWGIRSGAVLDPAIRDLMFAQRLGWYRGETPYGPYFHHNGGLFTGASPREETHTGAIHFPGGYDAVLLVNSGPPVNAIGLMARAYAGGP